jgi:hypothetical protein
MITVFSKEWFKKYNKILVKIAKIPFIGEWIFQLKKCGINKSNLEEITPYSAIEDMKLMWTKCVKVKGQWIAYDCTNALHNKLIKKECKEKLLPTKKAHIYPFNGFALRLQTVFYPIWITFHIWDIITRPIPQLNLGFDTLTQYPYSTSTTNPTCGRVFRVDSSTATWSSVRNGAGTSSQPQTNGTDVELFALGFIWGTSPDTFYIMFRSIACFNTNIGSGATISEAKVSVRGSAKEDHSDGAVSLGIVSASPNVTTTLQNSDYGQLGTTLFSSLAYGSYSTFAYNELTLNASGISNINKTGVSSFGFRDATFDVINSQPTGWEDQGYCLMSFYFSSASGNTYNPKLVVTYTVVVAPTVTTQSATLVKMSGATGNGNITNNGGGTITEKGICYILGTSGTPTTSDSTVHDHTDSTGAFTELITGLLTGRAYRFRAYAINSAGTGYGDTVQVYTLTNFLQMFQ